MAINKVVYKNRVLIDLTDATALAADVASGKYFYLASGEKVEGTASGGGESHNLPAGYTEYDYIEATGTQYIDTGYVPNADTEIIYTFQRTASQNFSACEFGVTPAPKVVLAGRYISLGSKTDKIGEYYPDSVFGYSTIRVNRSGLYDMIGRKIIDISDTTANTGALSLYLMARNNNGTAERKAKEKMRYFSASENDVKKIELIPAMRNSDSALGVYDTVRDVFLTNAGTGTFLGEVVN